MFSSNLINTFQRGLLKELIIDNDANLINYLSVYEEEGDIGKLYDSIIKLVIGG